MERQPTTFAEQMQSLLGDDFADFEASLHVVPPPCIRFNSGLKRPHTLPFEVAGEVAWCKSGAYLRERPSFAADPLFFVGAYYVQDAASMFVEQCVATVLKYIAPRRALDICASPGGKATHLASLLPDTLTVCNEVIRSRLSALKENLAKWGAANVVLTSADPSAFGKLDGFFDFILVDAPCSGEGMAGSDPEIIDAWTTDNILRCAARQRRIVSDVWDALTPGGFMLYSTCTYNTCENEAVVRYIIDTLGGESVPVDVSPFSGIRPALSDGIHACRFYPHTTGSRGLFVALLRKTGDIAHRQPRKSAGNGKHAKIPAEWLHRSERFVGLRHNDSLRFVPAAFADDIEYAGKNVFTVAAGTELCRFKGVVQTPSPQFACSAEINPAAFNVLEIEAADAAKFMNRSTLVAPSETPKGHVLLSFQNLPFGFVKNIGARCNQIH